MTSKDTDSRDYDAEMHAVREDLAALRGDVEKLVKAMGETAAEKGRETFNTAKDNLDDFADNARDTGKKGVVFTESQIEQNPFTSVASAFGVGLIIGRLLSK